MSGPPSNQVLKISARLADIQGEGLPFRGGVHMERRLAIVLAALLGGFSVLWVINIKVVDLAHAMLMLR